MMLLAANATTAAPAAVTPKGTTILARAHGPFFLVEAASRNKRYYKRELWEKAIEKNKPRLESRQMVGTIGHEQEINDIALRDGLVSHIVEKLWIDEKGMGRGEITVINTDVGRRLNTYLRSGMKFPVSSRAFGEFVPEQMIGDAQVINPETFQLETFDFVRNPGVEVATPRLALRSSYGPTVPFS
jgi:hypothetical protein